MATGNLEHLLRSIHGEVIKHSGIIFRQKNAHDENGQVIHEGKQEIYKVVHPRYNYWRERWRAQLHKPDPECELNKQTKKKQCYYQFDCFVRVAILWELRKK